MLTWEEIERYAHKISQPEFHADFEQVIRHLHHDDQVAVLERSEKMLRRMSVSFANEARAELKMVLLARTHGCPEDVPMIPWLVERGLV